MSRHLPYDGSHDTHEAQNLTASFRCRHFENRGRLGVFRWRGIERHLDAILERVTGGDRLVVDFGGAAGPLGFASVLVDLVENDCWGRPVPYHQLEELERPVDVLFTSHCLEHVPELEPVLARIAAALAPGGELLLHVPAFSCERWRAGVHRSRAHHDHLWTFALAATEVPPGLQSLVRIDDLVREHLEVELAEYCGDDSIFVWASKPDA